MMAQLSPSILPYSGEMILSLRTTMQMLVLVTVVLASPFSRYLAAKESAACRSLWVCELLGIS